MKYNKLLQLCFVFLVICGTNGDAQNTENWTRKDLTEPSSLAALIRANKTLPVLFNVGPSAIIPGSIDIGMVKDEKNLEKFKNELGKLPLNTNLLIYCGCCPFEHCPDVRPAIALLQKMKFTNYHLLNIPHNIKADWIDKGYPTTR